MDGRTAGVKDGWTDRRMTYTVAYMQLKIYVKCNSNSVTQSLELGLSLLLGYGPQRK